MGVVSSNPEACTWSRRPNFVRKGGFLVVERVLRPYRWPRHCWALNPQKQNNKGIVFCHIFESFLAIFCFSIILSTRLTLPFSLSQQEMPSRERFSQFSASSLIEIKMSLEIVLNNIPNSRHDILNRRLSWENLYFYGTHAASICEQPDETWSLDKGWYNNVWCQYKKWSSIECRMCQKRHMFQSS